jgi:hypothetical protein
MANQTFENFLIDKHADQYQGLDDDMPDDYDSWLEGLGIDDILAYSEEYGDGREQEILKLKGTILSMYDDCNECEYRWPDKKKEPNGNLKNSA